jgi:hypothetical protein
VYCHGTRQKLSFSLGQYTKVFQAEVYNYKNRNIYILSDSQAAIKALGSPQNWSVSATNPSYNWLNITGFNGYGCQVMRVLLVIQWQINW